MRAKSTSAPVLSEHIALGYIRAPMTSSGLAADNGKGLAYPVGRLFLISLSVCIFL